MYCDFFGLEEKPFNVTPDPGFLFLSPTHGEALAAVLYGIQERQGVIVLIGEAGTGKTTLLNAVRERLGKGVRVVGVPSSFGFSQILQNTRAALGLAQPEEEVSEAETIRRLGEFAADQLAAGRNVVLLIDEAQALGAETLESIRLLSNLETCKQKLVQIILSGQRRLDSILQQPELKQLFQRVSVRRIISRFDEKHTYQYIAHRLAKAKYKGPALFNQKAQALVWEYSRGLPRKINILCDNALLVAFGLGKKTVGAAIVEEAAADLGWKVPDKVVETHDSGESSKESPRESPGEPSEESPERFPSEFSEESPRESPEEPPKEPPIGTPEESPAEPPPPEETHSSRRPVLLAGLVLLGLVVVFGIFFYMKREAVKTQEHAQLRSNLVRRQVGETPGTLPPAGKVHSALPTALGNATVQGQEQEEGDGVPGHSSVRIAIPSQGGKVPEVAAVIAPVAQAQKPAPRPYAIELAVLKTIEEARARLGKYKSDGLSPYIVAMDLGRTGVWWRIEMGHFRTLEEAEKEKTGLSLGDVMIVNAPYANLVGTFNTVKDGALLAARLEQSGYPAYFMNGENGGFRLLVGAYETRTAGEEVQRKLGALNVNALVVER